MDFSKIVSIALMLLGKREEIVNIVKDGIELFNKVKGIVPELGTIVEKQTSNNEPMSITWLQESLNKLINAGLKVDGDYGNATKEAVKKFQMANPPLKVDGWAGIQTQAAIVDALQ